MEKQEVKKFLAMLQVHYPYVFKDYDEYAMTIATNSWYVHLGALDVRLVFNVAQTYIATDKTGFPPTVAHILEAYQKAINPSAFISGEEAWNVALKAINKFGSYQKTDGLASLSSSIEKAVRSVGWETLCMMKIDERDFVRKRFLDAYKEVEYAERTELVAPQLKERMGQLNQLIKETSDDKKLEFLETHTLEDIKGDLS